MLCADLCVTLSVCVCTTPVCVFASQSRAPQGRLKSPRFKSGLYTKFRDHGFLLTLERACEAQIWKGILRFRRVKSSNFFWPAGAAPQGRRGRGASRPARPGKNVIRKNQPDSLKIAKIGKTNLGHQNGLTQGSVKILGFVRFCATPCPTVQLFSVVTCFLSYVLVPPVIFSFFTFVKLQSWSRRQDLI